LALHFMSVPRAQRSAVRAHYTLEKVRSKRLRSHGERQALDQAGERACVVELQGDLTFAAAEACIRRVVAPQVAAEYVIIDLHRVSGIDACAARLLFDLLCRAGSGGVHVLFVNVHQHPRFARFLDEHRSRLPADQAPLTFPDLDRALEWCEDRLLGAGSHAPGSADTVGLREQELCSGLSDADLARLEGIVERRAFRPGTLIVRKGAAAEEIFLLARGQVSVVIDLPNGQLKRLSTVSPGMAFGELAAVHRSPRSADVRADTEVECHVLRTDAFDALGASHPGIKMQILGNLLRNLSQMLARTNRELAALAE
jgi:glutaminase